MNGDKLTWKVTFGQTSELLFDEGLITKIKARHTMFIYLYPYCNIFIDNSTETKDCI